MNFPTLLLLLLAAASSSWVFTGVVRRYAIAREILDRPNHRSSHLVPTPRGGGVGIIVVLTGGIAIFGATGALDKSLCLSLVAVVLLAVTGWIDDQIGLSARVRVVAQVVAAAWALYWLGGFTHIRIGQSSIDLGFAGTALSLFAIVWAANLFNFMDGIDGIAGGQALTAGFGFGVLSLIGRDYSTATVGFLIAGASLGFLAWNWSPAKIFMGDVGSAPLGFIFAVLALYAEKGGAIPLSSSLLLGGVFLTDASLTLLRRLRHGARLHEAHRSHAYQRAVIAGYSHAQVSAGVMAINSCVALGLLVTRNSTTLSSILQLASWVGLVLIYVAVERLHPMNIPERPTSQPAR